MSNQRKNNSARDKAMAEHKQAQSAYKKKYGTTDTKTTPTHTSTNPKAPAVAKKPARPVPKKRDPYDEQAREYQKNQKKRDAERAGAGERAKKTVNRMIDEPIKKKAVKKASAQPQTKPVQHQMGEKDSLKKTFDDYNKRID